MRTAGLTPARRNTMKKPTRPFERREAAVRAKVRAMYPDTPAVHS